MEQLDKSSQRSLCIKEDRDVLTAEQVEEVRRIKERYDLADFTFTNNRYGPSSGLSLGQRLLRAERLGLLKPLRKL